MNIAIVGAGIGGVACASALARVGIKAHIYEQARQFSRVGAGIQMGPNATHVLHGLGLKDQLANMAFQPKTNLNKVWDSGEVTNDYPLSEHVIAKYGAPFYALHRADLHESLANLVPSDQIHLNKKLVSLDQDGDGVVLTFEDGTQVQADAVIGADGVHSLVREILLGPEEPRFTGKVQSAATRHFGFTTAQPTSPLSQAEKTICRSLRWKLKVADVLSRPSCSEVYRTLLPTLRPAD
jgi:salicylate hydroxylase/6-hydroxynicotinate 3-monooxygenase